MAIEFEAGRRQQGNDIEGLRQSHARLLAALKRQGMIRSNGEWHLLNCRLGKRRGGLAPESCLGRCVAARAAIAKAEEEG